MLEDRDNVALNVYVAMCYYKLDYYDVSLEILAVYLQVRQAHSVGKVLLPIHHLTYPCAAVVEHP